MKANNMPITLSSPAPLDDGGRRFNYLYPVAAILLGIISAISEGGFALGALAGLGGGWFIKTMILQYKGLNLRKLEFQLDYPIESEKIISELVATLTPLKMMVEIDSDDSVIITRRGRIYDIILNENGTFSIWWRKSFTSIMFGFDGEISRYRKLVVDMGIIGYSIQQATMKESKRGEKEKNNVVLEKESMTQEQLDAEGSDTKGREDLQYVFCTNCGEKVSGMDRFCIRCGNNLQS